MNSRRKVVGALELEKKTLGNITAFPCVGTAIYNCSTDIAIPSDMNKSIYSFTKNQYSFLGVLNQVDSKDRTMFQEQVLGSTGKEDMVETSPILLANGNVVQEIYHFKYHPSDYEKTSPTIITVATRLVGINAAA